MCVHYIVTLLVSVKLCSSFTIYQFLVSYYLNPHSGSPHIVSETAGGSSPAEPEALKHLFDYLVNSIDTAALLPVALSRDLITDRQRSECASEVDPYKKAETLVGYLQQAVNSDYDNFNKFVQILKGTGQAHIASRLLG